MGHHSPLNSWPLFVLLDAIFTISCNWQACHVSLITRGGGAKLHCLPHVTVNHDSDRAGNVQCSQSQKSCSCQSMPPMTPTEAPQKLDPHPIPSLAVCGTARCCCPKPIRQRNPHCEISCVMDGCCCHPRPVH
jgi:hypothetical protein